MSISPDLRPGIVQPEGTSAMADHEGVANETSDGELATDPNRAFIEILQTPSLQALHGVIENQRREG